MAGKYHLRTSSEPFAGNDACEHFVQDIAGIFPGCSDDFLVMLLEQVTEHKFSQSDLNACFQHLRDTCQYRVPSLAEVAKFSPLRPSWAYEQALRQSHDEGRAMGKLFLPINTGTEVLWVRR